MQVFYLNSIMKVADMVTVYLYLTNISKKVKLTVVAEFCGGCVHISVVHGIQFFSFLVHFWNTVG
jgi:hypothetical protein